MNKRKAMLYGLIILLVGYNFRVVEHVTLTPQATRLLSQYTNQTPQAQAYVQVNDVAKDVTVPPALGWTCLAIGLVLLVCSPAFPE